jgi:hypothetical protein
MGKSAGKSFCGVVGEKFRRVVGLGGFSDNGGLVLGFNVGGDSTRGVSEGRACLPLDDALLAHIPLAVHGGERGNDDTGKSVLSRGLTGLDRSGLGNANLDIVGGDGGGDGVDVVERKVGCRHKPGDSIGSVSSGR